MHDVIVVGGGPSGCHAAALLAKQGFNVQIFEEHHRIGEPVDCSGVIGAEAFETIGLPENLKLDQICPLTLVSPSALRIHFSPPSPLAYILDRAALDRVFADQARTAGATFHMESSVIQVEVLRSGAELVYENRDKGSQKIQAKTVLLAGGPRYKLQRRLGMGVPRNFIKTAQTEVPIRDIEETTILLGSEIAPQSFAWIIPYRRGETTFARIGVSAKTSPTPYLKKLLQQLYDDGHLNSASASIRSWVIPVTPLPKTYAERILAIGDAAGQNKPTTGGGIFYGLLSAGAAAATISAAFKKGDFSEATMKGYENEWRKTLGREIKIGTFFRRLVERLTDNEIDELFRVVQSDGILKSVTKNARFDWHTDVIWFALRHPSMGRIFLNGLFSRNSSTVNRKSFSG